MFRCTHYTLHLKEIFDGVVGKLGIPEHPSTLVLSCEIKCKSILIPLRKYTGNWIFDPLKKTTNLVKSLDALVCERPIH